MIFNKYILYSILLGILGNILIWFQLNGQFKWDFMRNNVFLICLMGVPISYIFFKTTQFGYLGLGSLWGVRFLVYAVSYLVFPILTYLVLKDSSYFPIPIPKHQFSKRRRNRYSIRLKNPP